MKEVLLRGHAKRLTPMESEAHIELLVLKTWKKYEACSRLYSAVQRTWLEPAAGVLVTPQGSKRERKDG